MSKDDFRDRLKSYSSSPDSGEWSKMEQLLDADKDDRKKGFAWWRFGAALLLLGVAAFVVFETMSEEGSRELRAESRDEIVNREPRAESQGAIVNREPRTESRDAIVVQEEGSAIREKVNLDPGAESRDEIENREPRAESRDAIVFQENEIVVEEEGSNKKNEKSVAGSEMRDEIENREPRAESRDEIVVQEEGSEKQNEKSEAGSGNRDRFALQENIEVVQEVREEDVAIEKVSVDEKVIAQEVAEVIVPVVIEEIGVVEVEVAEEVKQEEPSVEIEKVIEEEEVTAVGEIASEEHVKLTSLNKGMKVWHVVTEVGIKYPIVDLENPVVGSLVPSQRFFPSYTAGLGIGRSFGRFSAELGVSAALYQFKLGEVVDQDRILVWGSQNSTISEDVISTSEEQFVINKFAIASPYLRTQYSIPLKNNFLLGLHSVFALNSVLNLPNQFESNQIASSNRLDELSVFDFNPLNNSGFPSGSSNGSFLSDEVISMNVDLGFSLEKTFADRGRLALDLSYTLATGYLERGRYTAFRESNFQSDGTYMISGKGPVVRLRYYLHYGKNG